MAILIRGWISLFDALGKTSTRGPNLPETAVHRTRETESKSPLSPDSIAETGQTDIR